MCPIVADGLHWTRTSDLVVVNDARYQLRHTPTKFGLLRRISLADAKQLWDEVALGVAIMGGMLLVTPLATTLGVLVALQLATGIGRGLPNTALMALSIRTVAPEHRATAMGVYQAVYAIGMFAGPVVGGVVAGAVGVDSVFYLSGILALVGKHCYISKETRSQLPSGESQ
jgi:MFS family permease